MYGVCSVCVVCVCPYVCPPLTSLTRALCLSQVQRCWTPRNEIRAHCLKKLTAWVGDKRDVKPPSAPIFYRLKHSHPSWHPRPCPHPPAQLAFPASSAARCPELKPHQARYSWGPSWPLRGLLTPRDALAVCWAGCPCSAPRAMYLHLPYSQPLTWTKLLCLPEPQFPRLQNGRWVQRGKSSS